MRSGFYAFGAGILSAFLLAAPVCAQDVKVNAVSFAEIPSGNTVTVETFNDSEQVVRLKKIVEDQLRANGFTVEDGARLILSVEIQDTSGKWTGGGPNRLVELRNSDDHTGKDAPDVRVSIFDSQRGGLLNPKRDKGITQVAPSQVRMDVSLEDRTDGKRLWQGWSVADDNNFGEDEALLHALTKPIVTNIGKTVRPE